MSRENPTYKEAITELGAYGHPIDDLADRAKDLKDTLFGAGFEGFKTSIQMTLEFAKSTNSVQYALANAIADSVGIAKPNRGADEQ